MELNDWLERYRRAWERADHDAVTALFTDAASYRSNPFRDPHEGRAAIGTYWQQATATQKDVRVRFGSPVVEGPRVSVEWWTEMEDEGSPRVLVGALILRFDDEGLCSELREYYNVQTGESMAPPTGWGD